MVCLRNISVDTLHKGETEDDDTTTTTTTTTNNNNNNKITAISFNFNVLIKRGKMSWQNYIWYMIYLLTATGLTPGGSSTVHIYTQTQYIEQYN